jgi:hypothetical protein
MRGNPIEALEAHLAQKLTACENFLSATRLLHQALEKDDGEETDRLLARRAGIIATVEGLDRQIDRCRQTLRAAGGPPPLPRLDALSARIGETIRATAREEGSCAAAAARRRETLKEALQAMQHAQSGLRGYGDNLPPGPRFLNLQT